MLRLSERTLLMVVLQIIYIFNIQHPPDSLKVTFCLQGSERPSRRLVRLIFGQVYPYSEQISMG